MPLKNFQYDAIMREYNRRQSANRHLLEQRQEEVYTLYPRLKEIDEEVASLSASKIRSLIQGHSTGMDDLRSSISLLSQERAALLTAYGYPANYLEMPYTCPLCQDTGYIEGKKCSCFRKAEIELLYTQSNLSEILKKENFDHFSFDFYSATITNESTGLSALDSAHKAYDTAKEFVRNFDHTFSNLFLYGNTGVGKTFLSHCIAHELIESAHGVMYFSAFDFFDLLADSAFSRKNEDVSEIELIYDSDLLIIDDLGTELTNSFTSSQLFLCINERIMRQKSTIISTNLSFREFSELYSERTFSRIASSYQMIKLIGNDIRLQKRFSGGN